MTKMTGFLVAVCCTLCPEKFTSRQASSTTAWTRSRGSFGGSRCRTEKPLGPPKQHLTATIVHKYRNIPYTSIQCSRLAYTSMSQETLGLVLSH